MGLERGVFPCRRGVGYLGVLNIFSGGCFLKLSTNRVEHSVGGNGTPIRPFWGVGDGWGSVWGHFFPHCFSQNLTFVRFNFDHEIFAFCGAIWSNASIDCESIAIPRRSPPGCFSGVPT